MPGGVFPAAQATRGSIPARAGEPRRDFDQWTASSPHWVYPRACGGTVVFARLNICKRGLSPRVRGNRATVSRSIPARAGEPKKYTTVIPARAGEPILVRLHHGPYQVYPRACGGTSPLPTTHPIDTVYPRACGGTCVIYIDGGPSEGLSPRVRGNRVTPVRITQDRNGLSPRVRGNLVMIAEGVFLPRSIPARAGEPPAPSPAGSTRGLSPRVRGNPWTLNDNRSGPGSIPARAGEPIN